MTKIIEIIKAADAPSAISLGHVSTTDRHRNMSDEQLEERIDLLWNEFQAGEPDSDSEFISYLVNHGFVEASSNQLTICLM